jgi:spore coat protein CotH
MENIINKLITSSHFFDVYLNLKDIKPDLLMYLYNNLENENYNILRWDLQIALKINANGEYI